MSILTLHDVSLNLSNRPLLDHVNWQIEAGEHLALVGRNGSGKSTLLKLLQGKIAADGGEIHRQRGLIVTRLEQEVPSVTEATVYACLLHGLEQQQQIDASTYSQIEEELDARLGWMWRAELETLLQELKLKPETRMTSLSGGLKRRVLLACALLKKPDLLLLDEPTNHLDIPAIEWLETYLKSFAGSLVLVTHDRTFLDHVTHSIVELDRGSLFTYADCHYEKFIERREARYQAEDTAHQLFDKRLHEEEVWIRTGIKARRTRNEGRVRALKAMREAYRQRRHRQGTVTCLKVETQRSGSLVIEACDLSYEIDHKTIIKNFSTILVRGDKVGIIGPNGCGKTTLVRLLLKELVPTHGTVRQGTALDVAYFDQLRGQLDENKTVMANVAEGSDFLTIQGKSKHIATYLQEFLFDKDRLNQPVSALSGGERNRLLLAKLFSRPVNILVMDEPTNDLDIETLELLEQQLVDYTGTLIVISHDRTFINNVVTHLWVYEGEGYFNEIIGDYDVYMQHRFSSLPALDIEKSAPPKKSLKSLNYEEQRELSKLPEQLQKLEDKLTLLQAQMGHPDFYEKTVVEQTKVTTLYRDLEHKIHTLYTRWEALEAKRN